VRTQRKHDNVAVGAGRREGTRRGKREREKKQVREWNLVEKKKEMLGERDKEKWPTNSGGLGNGSDDCL